MWRVFKEYVCHKKHISHKNLVAAMPRCVFTQSVGLDVDTGNASIKGYRRYKKLHDDTKGYTKERPYSVIERIAFSPIKDGPLMIGIFQS